MLNRWLLPGDIPATLCTPFHHDLRLVLVSYVVAAFAAYTAFDLIARLRAVADRGRRRLWLIIAGISMGCGIWAMHFIAMLALEIPIAVRFNIPLTALSALFAAVASALAFHLVAEETASKARLGLAGVVLGAGIGLMHYTGMAALDMSARIFYDPLLFALSVVVAVVLSVAALLVLASWPKPMARSQFPARVAGASVMGLAIVLMHYTGMLATRFYPIANLPEAGALFNRSIMAAVIAMVSLMIVGLALMAALFDRRAERAELLLRDAIESISEGFVIYDRDDRLVMCNQAYRALYAEDGRLLTPGMSFKDVARLALGRSRYSDADGREPQWFAELQHQHQEGVGSAERQLPNGSWVLATERRMNNGGTAGLRVDITALKAAQTALRDSEARLDRAQELAGIGSWQIDAVTGRRVWSNEMYRIRGIRRGEDDFTVDGIALFIHPDDRARFVAWITELRRGVAQHPIEYRIIRPDGVERIVRADGRPIFATDGTTTKVEGTLQDITEQRRTQQQLIQAQKMETVGQLTGGLAHDFNNILGAVIGNIELAQESAADPEAVGFCQTALDAALSAAELVKRLLAFSRRQALRPTATNLQGVIANVLPLARRAVGEQIRVQTRLAPFLWPAVADATQLESAILNLVVNARDAMPEGGTLTIAASNIEVGQPLTTTSGTLDTGEYVEISVSDTGVGMAADVLAQVFEPFFTTKGPGAGSGLGLSMVVGTMQQLGGGVKIESEPAAGTTVRLYLPRTIEAPLHAETVNQAPEPAPTGHASILLVEDNPDIRALGTGILRGLGYRVTVTNDGDAAWERLARGEHFDLLFTDIVMPGSLTGLALARKVRDRGLSIPILFTSGFSSPATLTREIDTFGATLIAKPYRKAELATAVNAILNPVAAG